MAEGGEGMSLQATDPRYVPEETVRIASAAFPKGNLAMSLRTELEGSYTDELFADLYPKRGKPAQAPWRLALVTVLQFAEELSDREATTAVKARLDWKFALGLELSDTGFEHAVLSKFRTRLIEGNAEHRLLDALLEVCKAKGLIRKRGQARTDSTHVLAKVRALNRIGSCVESMRAALNAVATVAPEWLSWVPESWFERYGPRYDDFRLPKGAEQLKVFTTQVGEDGWLLLQRLAEPDAPVWLAELPAITFLRRKWLQQYWLDHGTLCWRDVKDLPPTSIMLTSPYDPDARLGSKRSERWTGYKVHVTESCDEDKVHLLTQVETSEPNRHDNQLVPTIHQKLQDKQLLPERHLVDAGYMDTELLVDSRTDYDVMLHGPVQVNRRWQANTPDAYQIDDFTIDWDAKRVICPNDKQSVYWSERKDKRNGNDLIYVLFAKNDCFACEQRARCNRSEKHPRAIAFKPKEKHEALQSARRAQQTPDWHDVYAKRSGIEGTLSQGIRAFGLRRSRYFGHTKTHFQNEAIAAAVNITRLAAWFDHKPRAKTRVSRFAALAA
jgi:transposase